LSWLGGRQLPERVLVGRLVAVATLGAMLSACSMGGMFGGGGSTPSANTQALQNATASPDQIAAMSPALPAIATECPEIKVKPGDTVNAGDVLAVVE